jgi:hypothetical protein
LAGKRTKPISPQSKLAWLYVVRAKLRHSLTERRSHEFFFAKILKSAENRPKGDTSIYQRPESYHMNNMNIRFREKILNQTLNERN